MTIRFISIFSLSVFHWYKQKSCRNANIEGYFHFSSKWSLFSKIIVFSGHSKYLFLKNVSFWWRYFPLVKNVHFMQKVLVFGQMSEFLSTVIKSCRANFGVKWRVFFSTSIFVQKCQFWEKKLNFVRNVDFFKQLCTTTESEHLIGKHAYFQKIVTFCVIVYIHQETVEFW